MAFKKKKEFFKIVWPAHQPIKKWFVFLGLHVPICERKRSVEMMHCGSSICVGGWPLQLGSLTKAVSCGGVEGGKIGHYIENDIRFMGVKSNLDIIVLPRWSLQKMPLKRCGIQWWQLQTRHTPPHKHISWKSPFPEWSGAPHPVLGACNHPSFGEVHFLGWSHPVFVGLISGETA